MAATSNPFAATGTWLRCALHAHTTRSDGELSFYGRKAWTNPLWH